MLFYAFVTSQKTILPILNSEGMGHQCLDQKAPLMSDTKEQLPDWVTGLEGEIVTCEDDYQIEHQTSHSGECLTATCDKWDNGESISSIDTGRASIEHGAKTDSDLARPPG